MAYTFNGYGRNPVGGIEFVAQATNRLIRTLTMNTPFSGIAQRKAPGVQWRVSNCAAISLLDLGESDIHPVRKEQVGERWMRLALSRAYGIRRGLEAGPVLERVEWNGPQAILHFRNADGLQTSDGKPVKGFELAEPPQSGVTIDGAERKKDGKSVFGCIYHAAKAEIKGDTVILSAPEVREAFSLRYAWFDLNSGWNLVNRDQLPANTLLRFKDGVYHEQVYDWRDILTRKGGKQ